MTITDVSQYQTIFTANYTPDFIGGPYATLGAGPLSVLAVAAAAAGGPFPHYTRRRMRGGLIGMGV